MLTVLVMQVQLLELQAQRMESLVAQRRQERAEMEAENARIERQVRRVLDVVLSAAMLCGQVRYMKEMARENEEAEAEYARKQEELLAKHAPFSGPGHSLTAPSPAPAPPTAVSHAHWSPVTVDPGKPSGNIQVGSVIVVMMMMMMMMIIMMVQVRLAEGGRMVIKLNTDHTVAHIKQEIMARYGIA